MEWVARSRRTTSRRDLLAVVVLRQTVPAHVVHEEQRAADAHDHHDHEHEGEAAGPIPFLTGIDQLLRTGGHRQREERAGRDQRETEHGT